MSFDVALLGFLSVLPWGFFLILLFPGKNTPQRILLILLALFFRLFIYGDRFKITSYLLAGRKNSKKKWAYTYPDGAYRVHPSRDDGRILQRDFDPCVRITFCI